MKKNIGLIVSLVLTIIFSSCPAYAAPPPNTSQEVGGIQRTREMEERAKKLTSEIKKKKEKPPIEEEQIPAEAIPRLPSEKVLIKTIKVTGATLVPEKDIRDIVDPFENKELPLTEMQKVADLITDLYRKEGYITSRAYIAPQKIENNTFEIRIIEGKMGEVTGQRQ